MGNNLLEQCHKIKEEISNETTFHLGIENLLSLRTQLFDILVQFKVELCRADFNAIPFIEEVFTARQLPIPSGIYSVSRILLSIL